MSEFEQKLWVKMYIAMRTKGSSEGFSKSEADQAVKHFRDSDRRLTI